MQPDRPWSCGALAGALLGLLTAPAGATTLIRSSLDDLVKANSTIVVAEVVDAFSYWNDEATFILTDVELSASEVLKGTLESDGLTVTLMGGSVGDLTTLVVGGAELVPGRTYVLFLNQEDLPGAPGARTVRDHCQGAFDLVTKGGDLRAISQAIHHPLMPDALGLSEPPGGRAGLPIDTLVRSLDRLVGQEVKR